MPSGGEARDPADVHQGAPQKAVAVHRPPVRAAVEGARIDRDPLLPDGPRRGVVVVGEDGAPAGVGEIEGLAVGAEARAVGDDDAPLQAVEREIPDRADRSNLAPRG